MSHAVAPALRGLVRRAEPITGEELAALPDLGPCELVRGRIIEMSPTNWKHGLLVQAVADTLHRFVSARGPGKVLTDEVGLYTERAPDTVRGADVIVISNERLGRVRSESFLDVAPELVVEVLSPGNAAQEMSRKVAEYLAAGVDAVWVVDPVGRTVQVHRQSGVDAVEAGGTIRGEGLLDGLEVDVAVLFG
jgi:Uma2 family endonuclease